MTYSKGKGLVVHIRSFVVVDVDRSNKCLLRFDPALYGRRVSSVMWLASLPILPPALQHNA